jgi:hypothetical protein
MSSDDNEAVATTDSPVEQSGGEIFCSRGSVASRCLINKRTAVRFRYHHHLKIFENILKLQTIHGKKEWKCSLKNMSITLSFELS